MRTRFAPSPTGDLHLGGAFIALAAYCRARQSGGVFVVRVEDLDVAREVPGATTRILSDLRFLGLEWDEGPERSGAFGPYQQRLAGSLYEAALARLPTYPCTCSRAEIAGLPVSDAPHDGDPAPRYPGTCRDPARRRSGPFAVRLATPAGAVDFDDLLHGPITEDVAATVGDFVLRRRDGVWAYQLATAVDDGRMEIDEVHRGVDLLASTARQVLVQRLLGLRSPRTWAHLPLVVGPDGQRLAKRHQSRWIGSTISELRARGLAAEEILGPLGHALGFADGPEPATLASLVGRAARFPVGVRALVLPRGWVSARDPGRGISGGDGR